MGLRLAPFREKSEAPPLMTGSMRHPPTAFVPGRRQAPSVWRAASVTLTLAAVVVSSLLSAGWVPDSGGPVRASSSGLAPSTVTGSAGSGLTVSPPSARWGAQMVEDPAEGYTFFFSGSSGHSTQNGVPYGDSWTYESGIWTDITPATCTSATCPVARTYAGMSYYAHSGQKYVVMFGGRYSGVSVGDTWVFNGTWNNVTPDPLTPFVNSPPPLTYAAMVWDPVDGYDVLYGGCTGGGCDNSTISDQTWAFEGLNSAGLALWVNLTNADHPPSLYSSGFAFDSADGYLVLFGGGSTGVSHPTYENQTWSYTALSGWVNQTDAVVTAANTPPYRALIGGQMAYDPTIRSVVLFGGQHFWASPTAGDKSPNATINDTWTYSKGVWTNITGSLPGAPSPRFGGVMAFDASDNALLLFGGLSGTEVNAPSLSDTWWLTNKTLSWWQQSGVPAFPVKFTETGLSSGTEWWVNLSNSQSFKSTTTTLAFIEPVAIYHYSASAQGYKVISGSVNVSGRGGVSATVSFPPKSSPSGGLTRLDYLLIGGGVLVVAIGLTVLIIHRRRKARRSAAGSPPKPWEEAPAPEATPPPASPPPSAP